MDRTLKLSPSQACNETVQVKCPACESLQQIAKTNLIDASDSKTVEAILLGEVNRYTCPECDAAFMVDTPIVFRDDAQNKVIYFHPPGDDEEWAEIEKTVASITEHLFRPKKNTAPPDCRLTVDRREFIEKVALHFHGFNDKIIEYIKYQLFRNPNQNLDSVRSRLLYNFGVQKQELLAFVVVDRETGRATSGTHVPIDVYKEVADTLLANEDLADELDALFPGCYVSVERLL